MELLDVAGASIFVAGARPVWWLVVISGNSFFVFFWFLVAFAPVRSDMLMCHCDRSLSVSVNAERLAICFVVVMFGTTEDVSLEVVNVVM